MVEPLIYCEFCRRLIRPKEAGKPGYDIVNRKICCYDCLRDRFPVLFASRMEERRRLKEAANIPPPPPADTEAITAEVPVSGCGDAQADAGAFSATPGRSAQPASDLRAEEKSTGAAGSPAAAGGTGGSDDSGGRYASSGKDRGNAGPGAQSGANGGVAARPAQAAGEMSRPTHGTTGPVSARRLRAVGSVLL
ncbi:MAG: hypothetical protein N3A38_03210, partial [Planctomycetota bacterium]|nr:hypothetical protein [Planctomycetota bacterium]